MFDRSRWRAASHHVFVVRAWQCWRTPSVALKRTELATCTWLCFSTSCACCSCLAVLVHALARNMHKVVLQHIMCLLCMHEVPHGGAGALHLVVAYA